MWFIYLQVAWFVVWIGLSVERYPYGLLTMIMSLEGIFLSTFVMISQNRQNRELIHLSSQILDLTKAIHQLTLVQIGKSE